MGNAADVKREMLAALSSTMRDAMIGASDAVIAATPVDTGRARASWLLSAGEPQTAEPGPEVDTWPQVAGYASLASYDAEKDGPLFLVSNSAYMGRLDEGWSPQAEPGFVARAIMEGLNGTAKFRPVVERMLRGVAHSAFKRGL